MTDQPADPTATYNDQTSASTAHPSADGPSAATSTPTHSVGDVLRYERDPGNGADPIRGYGLVVDVAGDELVIAELTVGGARITADQVVTPDTE